MMVVSRGALDTSLSEHRLTASLNEEGRSLSFNEEDVSVINEDGTVEKRKVSEMGLGGLQEQGSISDGGGEGGGANQDGESHGSLDPNSAISRKKRRQSAASKKFGALARFSKKSNSLNSLGRSMIHQAVNE